MNASPTTRLPDVSTGLMAGMGALADEQHPASAIAVLDQALAIANQTVLRCKWQYGAALRYHSPQFAAAALGHANEARIHATRIVERIHALGGEPDPLPQAARQPVTQRGGKSLEAILDEQLAAARHTIQCYRKIAAYFESCDAVTAAMMDEIASGEETCADELEDVRQAQPAHAD